MMFPIQHTNKYFVVNLNVCKANSDNKEIFIYSFVCILPFYVSCFYSRQYSFISFQCFFVLLLINVYKENSIDSAMRVPIYMYIVLFREDINIKTDLIYAVTLKMFLIVLCSDNGIYIRSSLYIGQIACSLGLPAILKISHL